HCSVSDHGRSGGKCIGETQSAIASDCVQSQTDLSTAGCLLHVITKRFAIDQDNVAAFDAQLFHQLLSTNDIHRPVTQFARDLNHGSTSGRVGGVLNQPLVAL